MKKMLKWKIEMISIRNSAVLAAESSSRFDRRSSVLLSNSRKTSRRFFQQKKQQQLRGRLRANFWNNIVFRSGQNAVKNHRDCNKVTIYYFTYFTSTCWTHWPTFFSFFFFRFFLLRVTAFLRVVHLFLFFQFLSNLIKFLNNKLIFFVCFRRWSFHEIRGGSSFIIRRSSLALFYYLRSERAIHGTTYKSTKSWKS